MPASQLQCPLAFSGIAIATPASQLWSPLKFEQNTNVFFSNGMSREKIPIKPGFVPFDRIHFLAFLVFLKKWNDFGQKFQILENLNISGHRNCDAGIAIAMPENASGHCNWLHMLLKLTFLIRFIATIFTTIFDPMNFWRSPFTVDRDSIPSENVFELLRKLLFIFDYCRKKVVFYAVRQKRKVNTDNTAKYNYSK